MVQGDLVVLALLAVLLLSLLAFWLRRWLMAPAREGPSVEPDEEIVVTEVVELLEFAGYVVWTAKRRIPVNVELNDSVVLESRLYVDHFAMAGDELYVVKQTRERMPIEKTGSGLRDRLLMYQLLHEDVQGVLLVDPTRRTIDKIRFSIEW